MPEIVPERRLLQRFAWTNRGLGCVKCDGHVLHVHHARSFNGNISKWDVSSVKDMSSMFRRASSFNGDVAKWDVSRVKDMSNMFVSATSFNCDVSRWDVSKVATMEYMFRYATSFKHQLCGASWVYSKASKMNMFENSPGSIWQKKVKKPVCGPWPLPDTTLATHQYATRRPITERELIVQPLRQQPMIRGRAYGVVRSRNPADSVVALLVVLGTRTAEVSATETSITSGLRAWRRANVSSRLRACA